MASIDALGRTFTELHGGLREEREQRRVDIEHLAQSVVGRCTFTVSKPMLKALMVSAISA
jgi:hypothetical protein